TTSEVGLPTEARSSSRRAKVGEAGIRTLGTAFRPYNGLANRRLQPLGHLTAPRKYTAEQRVGAKRIVVGPARLTAARASNRLMMRAFISGVVLTLIVL